MLRNLCIAATSLLILAAYEENGSAYAPSSRITPATSTPSKPLSLHPCGESALLDHGVCVHLAEEVGEHPMAVLVSNQHVERGRGLRVYDQIPRRPDRPERYEAYLLPIVSHVISGYDLDLPDSHQRRAPTLRHTGHGGIDLPAERGTPVQVTTLEHQEQDAEVLYAGPLFGTTVVTLHAVREAGDVREYVVLYGHLDAIAGGIHAGRHLAAKEIVGLVGDTGSPGLVHLHLEIRRVRESVQIHDAVAKASGGAILQDWVTVVTDPRNLLPLAL